MPALASTETRTRWIDVQTAADILSMPERTVRHLCAEGELHARKFGRAWRIRREDVMPEEK